MGMWSGSGGCCGSDDEIGAEFDDEGLVTREVAKRLLGVSSRTFSRMVARGELAGERRCLGDGMGRVLYRMAVVVTLRERGW